MSPTIVAALITAISGIVGTTIGALLARPKSGVPDPEDRSAKKSSRSRQTRWFLGGAGVGLLIALVGFGVKSAWPRDSAPEMSIVSPEMGASVPAGEFDARGTWADVDDADAPRLVVYVPEVRLFYPDAEVVTLEEDGRWLARVAVGHPDDAGKAFHVIITTSDTDAQGAIDEYLADAAQTGDYPGLDELPEGVTRHATVTIERE